jgi:hypothetical protein
MGSLVLLVTLLACEAHPQAMSEDDPSESNASESDTHGGDELGCELALAPTSFACGDDDDGSAERCAYLASEPTLVVDWSIELIDGADEAALACVQGWLDAAGIAAQAKLTGFLIRDASYTQIEALCGSATILGCSPQASDAQCEHLDEAGCAIMPLCFSISGTPLAANLDCLEPNRFAFCVGSDLCSDAEVVLEDPEGGCWWFPAICIPGEAGWLPFTAACPELDVVQVLPMCP